MKRSKPTTPKTPKPAANQSSLLNFFNVTPKNSSTSLVKQVEEEKKSISPDENQFVQIDDDEDDLSPVKKAPAKRRRIVIESDDDEETVESMQVSPQKNDEPATPAKIQSSPETPPSSRHRIILRDDSPFEYEDQPTPSRKKPASANVTPSRGKGVGSLVKPALDSSPSRSKAAQSPATPRSHAVKEAYQSFLDDSEMEPEITAQKHSNKKKNADYDEFISKEVWPHEKLEWLKMEKIRDSNGRRADHPDYDPKTLLVPDSYLKEQSPGHQQWWRMKAQNFDTIIFFKVGKFYELYHMDAAIGINNLDLTPMRGNYCHCGFPEVAYGKYADMLLARGYKVARVEQTETPQMKDARNKTQASKDKVVLREICRITTASTKTFGVLDGTDDKNYMSTIEASSSYLLALVEEPLTARTSKYGLCFVDTTVGRFIFSQFEDDLTRTTLRTITAQFQPSHIIFPKGNISHGTQAVFQSALSAVKKEALFNKKEFYPEDTIVTKLMSAEYLGNDLDKWPKELETIFDMNLHVPRPLPDKELCVRALGGLMFYLNRCLIDVDMFAMRCFEEYRPPNLLSEEKPSISGVERWKGKNLVIDGATLLNLHLVPPFTGKRAVLRDATSIKFSLLHTIDSCRTPFAKRLIRMWVCSPCCDPSVITERQDAVEYLMKPEAKPLIDKMDKLLKKLPDLERLLQKINTMGLKYRSETHPDSRAQMFSKDNYNKRKINDLITTLNGFERISKLAKEYSALKSGKCSLIDKCIGSEFPDIDVDLAHFENAFDRKKAVEEGEIHPRRGIVPEYDQAIKSVNDCENACEAYCQRVKKELGNMKITLHGSGKTRYTLEIPDTFTSSKLTSDFVLRSKRKGFKRYGTKDLDNLVQELVNAENARNAIAADATRRVFADFSARRNKWNKAVDQIAILDCLASLAAFAVRCSDLGFPMVRPKFDFESDSPYVDIRKGYHPLLISGDVKLAKTASRFVPNDIVFGKVPDASEEPLVILLTGPNMSGKSTIMRQAAVLMVLSQMGGFVPADSMSLTPADRIFSRIGANDSSFEGQSTFYVELNETNSIMRNATKDSFVVIDELGRGTSTNDGTAIAGAVIKELTDSLKCRTFFSTHYFALCDLVRDNPNCKLAHMNFIIENENSENPVDEDITVLYNLVNGPCKKSYGFFAAKLAGVPVSIVKEASDAGKLLQEQQNRLKEKQSKIIAAQKRVKALQRLRDICTLEIDLNEISELIKAL